jgi:hypothetical protein
MTEPEKQAAAELGLEHVQHESDDPEECPCCGPLLRALRELMGAEA